MSTSRCLLRWTTRGGLDRWYCTKSVSGGVERGETPQGTPQPVHHIRNESWFGPKFVNPWSAPPYFGLWTFVRLLGEWIKSKGRRTTLLNNSQPTWDDIRKVFPLQSVDLGAFSLEQKRGLIQCLWIGHASNLVGLDDGIFLTDPVFSNYCGPFQHFGPKRCTPPPFALDDKALPKVNFVVISHNHYDHLDRTSVRLLHSRFGDQLRWYVPLNLKPWFHSRGISNVVELDWWEHVLDPSTGLKLTFTPCQHWSGRRMLDARRSLWGSWLVEGNANKVWFGGDSGYCPVFKDIGAKHGPIDLAMIPLGAYDPPWFMSHEHVNPLEAVKIHQDIQAKFSIGVHCCTFNLSKEPLDEPPTLLKKATEICGLGPKEFVTLQHGSVLQIQHGEAVNAPPTLPLL